MKLGTLSSRLKIPKSVRFQEQSCQAHAQRSFGIRSVYASQPDDQSYEIGTSSEIPSTIIEIGSFTYSTLKFIQGIILLFNSTVSPIILAFGLMGDGNMPLTYFQTSMDFVYAVLICCKFRTCVVDNHGNIQHGCRSIILHYLGGWFIIDLISIFPIEYLIKFQFDLSIIRLLNLVYNYDVSVIWAVNWLFSVINRYIDDFRHKFRRVFNYIIYFHVLICIWVFVNRLQGGKQQIKTDNPLSWKNRYLANNSDVEIYFQSMYFVLVTATTVGFGDMIPDTITEYIMTIAIMHLGVIAFSLVTGSIINAIRDQTNKMVQKRQKKNFIKKLIDGLCMPRNFRQKILKNISKVIYQEDINQQKQFLKKLPITMRSLLSYHLHQQWIKTVPYFRNKNKYFVGELCLHLTEVEIEQGGELFGQNQKPQVIYFIKSGSVRLEFQNNTQTEKLNWHIYGEIDFILLRKRVYQFRAIEPLTLLRLHKDQYGRIFNYLFPDEGRKMMRNAKNKYESIRNPQGHDHLQEPASALLTGAAGLPFLRLLEIEKNLEQVSKGIESLIQDFEQKKS